jgi:nitrite reductase/ring-hydroxylating ferredoxin subunit
MGKDLDKICLNRYGVDMLVHCAECGLEFDAPEGHVEYFCSITCACYHGSFNVSTGWVTDHINSSSCQCPSCRIEEAAILEIAKKRDQA